MIELLITDIDGVLTDGRKCYNAAGKVIMKQFNDRDWTAIKRFKSCGVKVIALSGDENINKVVCKNRNIEFYCSRSNKGLNKAKFLPRFKQKYNVKLEDMAYIGDDLFDLEILKSVGYRFCPADAIADIKAFCQTLPAFGGDGVLASLFEFCRESQYILSDNMDIITKLDGNERQ